jgi:N-acetyl-anhydromuramyl-L-alanine amidase AmpD
MKRKIILLLLILILILLAWRLFVDNFSQEPIEIIIENQKNNKEEFVFNENKENNSGSSSAEVKEENKIVKNQGKVKETTETENSFIINKKVAWGYETSKNRNTDTLLIHSSYDALGSEPYNLNGLIKEYQQYSVAPHFLIDRKGNVYKLVDEKNIAYHAGVGKMPDGRTGVNNFSLGIELMNTKEDQYTSAQYSSLNKLIEHLENHHSIEYILGHQDISPDRKTDPWNFDWKKVNSKNAIH